MQIDLFSVTVQFLMFYSFLCMMKKIQSVIYVFVQHFLSSFHLSFFVFLICLQLIRRRMPTFTHGEIYFAWSHVRYGRRDRYLESYIFRWKQNFLRQLPSSTYLFPTKYFFFIEKISILVFVHYKSSMRSKLVKKHFPSMIKVN